MRWTLIQLAGFKRLWESQRLDDEDLRALEMAIMRDPASAVVMRGTGGLREIRFAPPSQGRDKSRSMRVAFAQFHEFARIYFVTSFLKEDAENLSAADRQATRKLLGDLTDELRKGRNK